MNASTLRLLFTALCVIGLLSSGRTAEPPKQGDHIDIVLADGRAYRGVEVINSDATSVFIRDGRNLISFSTGSIRSFKQIGTTQETDAVPPANQSKPANIVPVGTPAPTPQPITRTEQVDAPQQINKSKTNTPIFILTTLLAFSLLASVLFGLWQHRSRCSSEKTVVELRAQLSGLEAKYGGLIDLDKVLGERQRQIDSAIMEFRLRTAEQAQVEADLLAIKGFFRNLNG